MKYYAPQHDLAERRFLQQNVDILPTEYGRLKRNLTTQKFGNYEIGVSLQPIFGGFEQMEFWFF